MVAQADTVIVTKKGARLRRCCSYLASSFTAPGRQDPSFSRMPLAAIIGSWATINP